VIVAHGWCPWGGGDRAGLSLLQNGSLSLSLSLSLSPFLPLAPLSVSVTPLCLSC
jgi:hypothetical protein